MWSSEEEGKSRYREVSPRLYCIAALGMIHSTHVLHRVKGNFSEEMSTELSAGVRPGNFFFCMCMCTCMCICMCNGQGGGYKERQYKVEAKENMVIWKTKGVWRELGEDGYGDTEA